MDAHELENEIEKIKERNLRVEADKAWETSATRKLCVAILTYFVVVVLFIFLGVTKPWLSALVPTVAFVVSTLSLAIIQRFWLRTVYKK